MNREDLLKKVVNRDSAQTREIFRMAVPEGEVHEIEQIILDLLAKRGTGKTICPSEAARRMAELAGSPERWRSWMKTTRITANAMASRGTIVILQRGERVDPASARGAVRLALP